MIWDIIHVCNTNIVGRQNVGVWGLFRFLSLSIRNNNSDALKISKLCAISSGGEWTADVLLSVSGMELEMEELVEVTVLMEGLMP